MTVNGTTPPSDHRSDDAAPVTAGRPPLRRPRDRVLGGVCAAIATHLGVDVALVRLAAIVSAVLTGGTALLAYLAGWLLIPQADGSPTAAPPDGVLAADPPAASSARYAWQVVGADLRTLGGALRPIPQEPAAGPAEPARGPLAGVDSALTGLGDRLRDPEVQARARQAATGLGAAIGASLDGAGKRVRRH